MNAQTQVINDQAGVVVDLDMNQRRAVSMPAASVISGG